MAVALNWTGLRKEAAQPIVKHIRTFFPLIFPEVPMFNPKGHVGGYNAASFGGGHEYGLAADIYVRVDMPDEKRVGDGLLELFMENATELGVTKVIWNRRAWEAGKDPEGSTRPYTGPKPHTDHVHVSFSRKASQFQPPRLAFLMKELHDRLFGALK
jgi:hypothetical protein